jgi:hypothetical protein
MDDLEQQHKQNVSILGHCRGQRRMLADQREVLAKRVNSLRGSIGLIATNLHPTPQVSRANLVLATIQTWASLSGIRHHKAFDYAPGV